MDLPKYITKLENEILRLKDALDEKEIEFKEKVCEAYNAGFREGIKNGELNIIEQQEGIKLNSFNN